MFLSGREAEGPVKLLQADCLTGIPQGYITLVMRWKKFSCHLSTPDSSSISGDANLTWHADLDCATVKTHSSEFYKATEDCCFFYF